MLPPFHNSLILRPRQFSLEIHNLFDLHQEPAVNFREVEDFFDGEAGGHWCDFWNNLADSSTIDFTPVPDSDDDDLQNAIMNFVDDAVIPNPNPPCFAAF